MSEKRIIIAFGVFAVLALFMRVQTPNQGIWLLTDLPVWRRHTDIATTAFKEKRYEVAEREFSAAVKVAQKDPNPGFIAASSLCNLAVTERFLNKNKQSEEDFKLAIVLIPRSDHIHKVDRARMLHELAQLYLQESRYGDAEPLLEEAVSLTEDSKSKELEHAQYLDSLSVAYSRQNRSDDAETAFRQSLAVKERVLGPNDPKVIQHRKDLETFIAHRK